MRVVRPGNQQGPMSRDSGLSLEDKKHIPQNLNNAKKAASQMAAQLLASAGIDNAKINNPTDYASMIKQIDGKSQATPEQMVQAATQLQQGEQRVPVQQPVQQPLQPVQQSLPQTPILQPSMMQPPQVADPKDIEIAQLRQQVAALQQPAPPPQDFMSTGPRIPNVPQRKTTSFPRNTTKPTNPTGNAFRGVIDRFRGIK